MQEVLPWLFWARCFSHRLELACKNAFKSSLFTEINDMLLQLFYLYKNSPKKTKELATIGEELKGHFPKRGSAPIRCQGTPWITHKRRAIQRIVARYGTYIQHLTAMVNDSDVKSADSAKLQGYLNKWAQGKMLIGCVMYADILKAPSLLSLSL